ncbi:ethanolamine-phosphate cytidylyltransferase-like isoform X2 [Symsagittifera roscoffensis]|uniref:ethanolamine-phosphate cytidylyltransferase-like isoform X2 n=1 Tax=Symsagittifera roscoffensis TaxID=84072 RepID=UPI00307C8678
MTFDICTSWSSKVESHERLLLDGCFDLFHLGHANALRQAKQLGGYLVAATHSDHEIRRCKEGEPIYSQSERVKILRAVKWVDQIIQNAPYSLTVADLKKFRVDYSVHGDDISIGADGLDCHSETKTAGMYKIIRRTRGISTTTILGALIRLVTQRETREVNGNYNHSQQNSNCDENTSLGEVHKIPQQKLSKSAFAKEENCGKVAANVWCRSTFFDSSSPNHFNLNKESKNNSITDDEKAKSHGDYLVVGLFSDQTISGLVGPNYPLISLEHRALCLSALSMVDELVINAPANNHDQMQVIMDHYKVTHIAMNSMNHIGPITPSDVELGFHIKYPLEESSIEAIEIPTEINFDTILTRIKINSVKLGETFEMKNSKTLLFELPGEFNLI